MHRERTLWTTTTAAAGLILALCLGGCGSADKAPAEAAIKATESALESVRTEAAKYVPDQLKAAEDTLRSAKASFDKGEYKAALTAAQALPAQVQGLGAAASAKKAELAKAWDQASAGVPQMAEAIKSRVDILSQSKKLPAGLDKEKFDGAKAGLDQLNQSWTSASDAFKAGDVAGAIGKAQAAKAKAVEVMTALNMQVPAGAR